MSHDNAMSRRAILRGAVLIGGVPILGSVLASCSGDNPQESSASSDLRVLPPAGLTTLDPARWSSEADQWAQLAIYQGLVAFKPGSHELENVLADSLEVSEDGLEVQFTLKPDMPFHKDYGVVTAEDVKFSFERIAGIDQPGLNSTIEPDWAALESVEVLDEFSGVIHLKSTFGPLMVSTLPGMAGLVVSKKAVTELGDKFSTQPVGSGPYSVERYQAGSTIDLKRVPHSSEGAEGETDQSPDWSSIEMPLTGSETSDVALRGGSVDVAALSLSSIAQLETQSDFEITGYDTGYMSFITINELIPGLDNIDVRRAIRDAVDIESILEAAFDGHWPRATAAVSPVFSNGYWEDAPVYKRDVSRAQNYMNEAGVERLELTLTINTDDYGSQTVAEIVQTNLKDIGIEIEIVPMDSGSFYTLGTGLRERQLMFSSWTGGEGDPASVLQWFTSDQVDKWNWMYWESEEYDDLFQEALAEVDQTRRLELYVRMQEIWDDACNAVWVTWPRTEVGMKKGIETAATFWGQPLVSEFRSNT